ncbi:MAG: CRISPR-associated endonuclease Cas2 [Nitrospiraceae bacterium]|jgi:CRISPR-associated protein Cas2|nr:CRISPR-associated endonuclease Cas2 [Nitrospiraceae bacterium]
MPAKYYVVVAYDIKDDRRRGRVSDILSACGSRANYSVFECFVTKRQLNSMKSSIRREIHKKEDIVLYYTLCRACVETIEREGLFKPEKQMVKIV